MAEATLLETVKRRQRNRQNFPMNDNFRKQNYNNQGYQRPTYRANAQNFPQNNRGNSGPPFYRGPNTFGYQGNRNMNSNRNFNNFNNRRGQNLN